jgi:hypothetical protein
LEAHLHCDLDHRLLSGFTVTLVGSTYKISAKKDLSPVPYLPGTVLVTVGFELKAFLLPNKPNVRIIPPQARA